MTKSPMTTKHVAQQLGYSEDSIRNWAKAGRLRFTVTQGGVKLFDPEEVARFAQERAQRGGRRPK